MRRATLRASCCRLGRSICAAMIMTAIMAGATGLSCDSDAAATFRQETTQDIGDGIKTILDAVVDGLVAAIEQAGDGSATGSQ